MSDTQKFTRKSPYSVGRASRENLWQVFYPFPAPWVGHTQSKSGEIGQKAAHRASQNPPYRVNLVWVFNLICGALKVQSLPNTVYTTHTNPSKNSSLEREPKRTVLTGACGQRATDGMVRPSHGSGAVGSM